MLLIFLILGLNGINEVRYSFHTQHFVNIASNSGDKQDNTVFLGTLYGTI